MNSSYKRCIYLLIESNEPGETERMTDKGPDGGGGLSVK